VILTDANIGINDALGTVKSWIFSCRTHGESGQEADTEEQNEKNIRSRKSTFILY
jgi:hypothetical protein